MQKLVVVHRKRSVHCLSCGRLLTGNASIVDGRGKCCQLEYLEKVNKELTRQLEFLKAYVDCQLEKSKIDLSGERGVNKLRRVQNG